ncbi:MAG: LTA synthase family protein [Eubacteriales bacterium]|nr:LTA synthase family protein [Eubacteriales bacterium]
MKRLWKLLACLFAAALCIYLLVELVSRKSVTELAGYVAGSPMVFLLNVLLTLTPFLSVFFVRRKVFLAAVIAMAELAMGVVNGVLLMFRTTPFTAEDFHLLKYGAALLTTYLSWPQILLLAAALVLAVCAAVVLWRKAPADSCPVNKTESACVAAVALAVIWGSLNLAVLGGVVALQFGNIGQAFQDYGFAYCFANSAFNTGISKPDAYDDQVMEELRKKDMVPENTYSVEEYKTPNIIMVQLESFFDPMLWENNPAEKDPIPYFRFLARNFPSGYLSVPSVGAGTANTEFECITGMNLDFFGPGEYPYKTVLQKKTCESIAFDLKELGYKTHAIHNNEATFYDRHKVFPRLGFDTFTPIEYMYNVQRNPTGWCRDKILTEEIGKAMDSTVGQDFIYTISVQGHGKYPSFAYYCEQIGEMDDFISELVAMLNSRNEPSVLVLYGDHLPGFEWTQEEMKNRSLFQTEYVIWNNLNLPKTTRDLEAYQLTSHVLDLLDIHEGTMIRFHQRHLERGDTKTQAYLDAAKILEYDMLYGDQEVYGGSSPYKAVSMEYGVNPIIQKTTVRNGDTIEVTGEGFNTWSRICVNGKPAETKFISRQKLTAENTAPEPDEEITVQQIGRDKVGLGTARKSPGA